jgi:di/tricarboxylate transporter
MKKILALAVLAILSIGAAETAYAASCNTTCYGSGNYRSCQTNCW